jgi:hypothetical protein
VGFEQMLRRRQINGRPQRRSLRFLPALSGFLLGVADVVRWPFERAAWAIERGVLWPLRERFTGRSSSSHRGGAAALIATVAIAVLAGVLLLPRGDGASKTAATPTRVAVATPEPARAVQPHGPLLKGATPSFGVGKGVGVARAHDGAGAELNAGSQGEAAPATGETPPPEEAAATTSSEKPVPAGPAAMKVARRFSKAFVFYEIGEHPAEAKAVFGETATAELATALGERPPRLPADAKVPKARVVNLVPGPRAGKAYTVSVSLLRVGITSELRLTLRQEKNGAWNVAQILG